MAMKGIRCFFCIQRVGGRCEPTAEEVCIAHPGAACVRSDFSAGRNAPLQAGFLMGNRKAPRVLRGNQGGTAGI